MNRLADPVGATAAVCALLGVAAAALGLSLGGGTAGVAVAAGLVLGSVNPPLARRALGAEVDFRVTSAVRLAALTAAGIGVAALLGLRTAPLVLAGLGASQLVLALVSGVLAVRR